ncbi:hypothetical protein RB597_005442 [Gaeumannomyces tritici]
MVSKNMLFAMAAAMTLDLTNASSAVSRSLQRRHVSLAEPRPYKGTGYGPTNPLDTDGGNYPCKAPGGDGSKLEIDGAPTEVVIGEPVTVSFSGHAVHGGGSCQFGLTEGFAPTKNSVFKVIQSIEGGCPKANQVGNLEGGQQPDKFSFTVPTDFAPGDYTFGWIWINRVGGSPEIYMNCAPLKVKAGKGSTRRSKERRQGTYLGERQTPAYPDFFLANLGSVTGECSTNEALKQQVPIKYPHPGSNVIHPEGTSKLFAQPCDGNPHNKGGAAPPAKPSGTASTSAGAPTKTQSNGEKPSTTTTAAPTSTSTRVISSSATSTASSTRVPSSSTTTTAISTSATSATTPTSAPSTSAPTKPCTTMTMTTMTTICTTGPGSASPTPAKPAPTSSTPTTPARPTARPPTPANPQTPPGSCTDGHLLCVETVMFSICTGGRWIKPQGLADNTVCALEGESVGLKLTVLW